MFINSVIYILIVIRNKLVAKVVTTLCLLLSPVKVADAVIRVAKYLLIFNACSALNTVLNLSVE